jgi:hypothetical protein
MTSDQRQPEPLHVVQRDSMWHDTELRPTTAAKMSAESDEFRLTSAEALAGGRKIAAASNLHEAAQLAITAVAATKGLSFRGEGTHKAVIDYGLGVGVISRDDWSTLEDLRVIRNRNNYAADMIELPPAHFERLLDCLARIQSSFRPASLRSIPPPPRQ